MRQILSFSLVILPLFLNVVRSEAGEKAKPMTVSAGEEITLEYPLKGATLRAVPSVPR